MKKMTNLKLTCNICGKDLIIFSNLVIEPLYKSITIKDFWVITCKDCVPNATVFRITSEEEKQYKKDVKEGKLNAFVSK